MRALTTLFACPVVALAAVITQRSLPAPDGPWTAGVWRQPSTDDVFFSGTAINASGGKFFINRNTTAACPDDVENLDCSTYPGSKTVFTGGNDTIFLDVGVPGGQQVYVAEDGSLSYTVAHSADLPDGAVATGFVRERSESFGAPVTLANGNQTWAICPVSEGEPRERTYQVYVGTATEDCLYTGVRTYTSTGPDAWEYA
ncbi:hypothetical protein F4804DRAFT_275799 [Jackrogersella minutella]|nr:hypothetical protein F4804DRAFT_275799 [Jackrogersella minutella]